MSRTVRSIWVSVFALAIGSGTALADHHEGEAAPGPDAAAAAPAGKLKAGAKVMIPKGPNDEGEMSIGSWIEVTPWANYQVNEKITAGVAAPLMLISPDTGDSGIEFDLLQAVMGTVNYGINDQLAATGMVGIGAQGRLGINPWGGGQGFPASPGDMKVGLGAGASYSHKMDKIHINAGGQLVVQLDSDVDDEGELKPLIVVHVPVMAMYAVNEQLSAGVATGLYTGSDVSFDADEGFTVPFVVGGKYAVNPNISAGAFAGLGSLMTAEGLDVGDTLTLGVFVGYSQ